MNNVTKDIQKLEELVLANKTEIITLTERIKNFDEEREKILTKIKEKGIDADNLEDTLQSLKVKFIEKVEEIKKELK